jgi:hypothetical protein
VKAYVLEFRTKLEATTRTSKGLQLKLSRSAYYTVSAVTALAMLTACNDAGTSLAPPNSQPGNLIGHVLLPGSNATAVRPDRHASWMDLDAKKSILLYGAAFSTNDVDVYTYPKGKLVGTLTGFNEPQGECVDHAGNVFVANTGTSQIIEYAHGGTSPIATLNDPNQYPVSCSVDPSTGDLGVTNILSTSGGPGSVSIYKKARGTPKTYSDSNFARMDFLGYDNSGNLFVDGSNSSASFRYAELPKGSKTFIDITLEKTIGFPGDIQYDGTYTAIGDQGNANVYQTSGGTVVGTTTLGGAQQVGTFFILGDKILCPESCNGDVAIYAYPAGGAPIKTLKLADGAPGVVVISK